MNEIFKNAFETDFLLLFGPFMYIGLAISGYILPIKMI